MAVSQLFGHGTSLSSSHIFLGSDCDTVALFPHGDDHSTSYYLSWSFWLEMYGSHITCKINHNSQLIGTLTGSSDRTASAPPLRISILTGKV